MTRVTTFAGHLLRGAVAGAAATTALNAATHVDMALRGRPASSTPERTVERAAATLGVALPGDEEQRQARVSGLGSLLGAAAGVGVGVALGAARGVVGRPHSRLGTAGAAWGLAMLVGNGPMTVLGVTDPRSWRAADWAADVLPHLAYAVVAESALHLLEPPD